MLRLSMKSVKKRKLNENSVDFDCRSQYSIKFCFSKYWMFFLSLFFQVNLKVEFFQVG